LAVIRGQKARGEEAVAAYEKAVQAAYRDAENGLATFAADTKRSSDLQVAEGRARFAFEAKRRGYDLGLTDLTTLLEAERTWRQTLSVYNGARTTALVDAATLFQALGGGWSPEQTLAPGKA
jgi:outer membrane protein TolC